MAKPKTPKRIPPPSSKPQAAAKPAVAVADPTFAVQAAAAMVGQKVTGANSSGGKKESSTFKQLKEGLNKPAIQSINNLLDKTGSNTAKKSALPFSHNTKQVGHNQTFGADVNRAGVPRRTGG
jgi:hypothetical protein